MIVGEIKRFLRDDGILKVSRSIKENQYKIYKVREEMEKKLGRGAGYGGAFQSYGHAGGGACHDHGVCG